jgi:hypothetical protein
LNLERLDFRFSFLDDIDICDLLSVALLDAFGFLWLK